MKLNNKLYLVATAVLILIIWNANSQPGVGDLIGGFEEVAMYRNENNTGPINRVYIVSVTDSESAEMRSYGDYMLHTKFGNTKVYFFSKEDPTPLKVEGGAVNFDSKFDQYIVAKYEKNASGLVNFQQFQ